jgi:diguanylate cyclase (GGDEF)-like protein
MKKPGKPHNEEARLKALQSLNILDTQPEERFDRLTRLARRMFGVPIALVSLVDENRQWFKSHDGIDVSETPREISFCGHAIHDDSLFIVNDAASDERFSDNPLVLNDPNIRFYAGYPLKHHDGSRLGTLCIIDKEPRSLSEEDIEAFNDLAQLAEHELAAFQLATLDELTGISNRRGFAILAQNSMSLCARQGMIATLVFLDLDNFKLINDNFGHAEGDQALIAFADQMRNTFRDSDIFARIGGDEFVVLLTNTSTEIANEIITRFRLSVDTYYREAGRGYDISFSEGIVEVECDQNSSIEALLNQADSLMYKHKPAK